MMFTVSPQEELMTKVTDFDFSELRNYAIAFIRNLLMAENLCFLTTDHALVAEVFMPCLSRRKEIASIKEAIASDRKAKPKPNTPLTSQEQEDLFIHSIDVSKAILTCIHSEFSSDASQGVKLDAINGFMSQPDDILTDEQIKIKIKYDVLMQALGQALGNLREYDVLSDFCRMDIIAENFQVLRKVVLMAKNFRNLRTHKGFYDADLFQGVWSRIFQSDSAGRIVIFHDLDQARERYLSGIQKPSRAESQFSCNMM